VNDSIRQILNHMNKEKLTALVSLLEEVRQTLAD
jgi:hypothetical protein